MSSHDKQLKMKVNEADVFYREHGSGRPVLMIHGNPGSHTDFDELAKVMAAKGFRCVVPDRPGHGKNVKIQNFVDGKYNATGFFAEMIDKVCDGKAIVVGYSLGAYYAMKLAFAYPEKVGGLALVAPFISAKETDKASSIPRMMKLPVINKIISMIAPIAADGKLKKHLANVFSPESLDPARLKAYLVEYETIESVLATVTDKNELIDSAIDPSKMKKVECPCVVICGKKDMVINSVGQGEKIKQHVKHAFVENISDGGHGMMFNAALAARIADVIITNIEPKEAVNA